MTFSELLKEIQATYRTETRAFHVLATRYYLGHETRATLERLASHSRGRKPLTYTEVDAIIANR